MMNTYCDRHSGLEKQIEHLEQMAGGVEKIHARVDAVEETRLPNRVFYWFMGILISVLLLAFGQIAQKLNAIERGVIILQTEAALMKGPLK